MTLILTLSATPFHALPQASTLYNCRQRIGSIHNTAARLLVALGYGVVSSLTRLAILAARPLIVLLLRQLVRNRSFWERGLRGAWVRKVRSLQSPGAGSWQGIGSNSPPPCVLSPACAEKSGAGEASQRINLVGKGVRWQPCQSRWLRHCGGFQGET